jgi:hypothetical protein
MPATHAMTVRLPEPVYKTARRLARQHGISINRLVEMAITEQAKHSLEARVRAAYDVLSEDTNDDVEGALALQAGALLGE